MEFARQAVYCVYKIQNTDKHSSAENMAWRVISLYYAHTGELHIGFLPLCGTARRNSREEPTRKMNVLPVFLLHSTQMSQWHAKWRKEKGNTYLYSKLLLLFIIRNKDGFYILYANKSFIFHCLLLKVAQSVKCLLSHNFIRDKLMDRFKLKECKIKTAQNSSSIQKLENILYL